MSNVPTIQGLYAAFERGDVPEVLSHMAEDIEWEYFPLSVDVPWLRSYRGRAEVPKFFQTIGSGFDFHRFEPKTFLENGNVVVVLIDVDFTVKATGHRIQEEDEVHIWRFDDAGRITRFAHKLDTHRHLMSCGAAV